MISFAEQGGDVTPEEFNTTALITEDSNRKTVDVRPFGDRQGEAVDYYLYDLCRKIADPTFTISKPIVVLHESGTVFPPTAMDWLKNLLALGVRIGIQPADS